MQQRLDLNGLFSALAAVIYSDEYRNEDKHEGPDLEMTESCNSIMEQLFQASKIDKNLLLSVHTLTFCHNIPI